jgi:alpha-galactosidase
MAVIVTLIAFDMITASVTVGAPAAQAAPDGTNQTPVVGWSSWSFLRLGANATEVEGEARAMATSGRASVGYQYIKLDDGWYQCPGPQGPNIDQYGRWLVNPTNYPTVCLDNGIQASATYVHSLGLKFGIYETAGISEQAVAENSPILGTSYTADEIAPPRHKTVTIVAVW